MSTAAGGYVRSRLGDTTSQIVGGAAQTAGAGLATVSAAASAGLLTLGATAAAAIPVAGALIAVGTLIYGLLHNTRGLQQDAETTAVVNQASAFMVQNLAAWNASTKSYADQQQAEKNFDDAWAGIQKFCSQPSEGSPGQRCISERQRGGKYDYFAAYLDPIANDPEAGAVDRAAAASLASTIAIPGLASGSTNWWLALPAALLIAGLVSN